MDSETARFKAFLKEIETHSPQWAKKMATVESPFELRQMALRLFNFASHMNGASNGTSTGDTGTRIQRFVMDNLHTGPTLKDLAKFLGYSEKYCSDLFQAKTGESFSRYLKRLRVQTATRMLVETPMPVSEIATAVGFSDQFTFSHFFRRTLGCSPTEYRRRRKAEIGISRAIGVPEVFSHRPRQKHAARRSGFLARNAETPPR